MHLHQLCDHDCPRAVVRTIANPTDKPIVYTGAVFGVLGPVEHIQPRAPEQLELVGRPFTLKQAAQRSVDQLTDREREVMRERFDFYEEPRFCPVCAAASPFEQTTPGNPWDARYTCGCGTSWKMVHVR